MTHWATNAAWRHCGSPVGQIWMEGIKTGLDAATTRRWVRGEMQCLAQSHVQWIRRPHTQLQHALGRIFLKKCWVEGTTCGECTGTDVQWWFCTEAAKTAGDTFLSSSNKKEPSKSKIGSVVRRHAGNGVAPKCEFRVMVLVQASTHPCGFFSSKLLKVKDGWAAHSGPPGGRKAFYETIVAL